VIEIIDGVLDDTIAHIAVVPVQNIPNHSKSYECEKLIRKTKLKYNTIERTVFCIKDIYPQNNMYLSQ